MKRLVTAPLELVRAWIVRFVELQGVDRAVALAGQAFTALVPLVIVSTALVSQRTGRDFADRVIRSFDLTGSAAATVRQAIAPAGTVEGSVTVLGAVLLLFSALSFTRALQRLYQLAWRQPPLGLQAAKWGLLWLLMAIVVAVVRPVLVGALDGTARIAVGLALGALVWLAGPYLLLGRRVAWPRLVPSALLTAGGMTALTVSSLVWMPRTVASSAAQFGAIGVAFALLSWLVGAGFVLVIAAAGGSAIDDRVTRSGEDRSPGARAPSRADVGRDRT